MQIQHKNHGASLIELLISLVLVSIILLGIDAVQLTALQQAQANYYFAIAKQQMSNIGEQLAIHKDNNLNTIVMAWNKQNQRSLPLGNGRISLYPETKIAMFWGDKNGGNCKANTIGVSGCLSI